VEDAMRIGSETFDGTVSYHCLAVGLSEAQAQACATALLPIKIVRVDDVVDACARMSTVLPLVVAVDEGMSGPEQRTLREYADPCGAEIVAIPSDERELARRLLDGLRAAERRRYRSPA
jgi:hypothetical protein